MFRKGPVICVSERTSYKSVSETTSNKRVSEKHHKLKEEFQNHMTTLYIAFILQLLLQVYTVVLCLELLFFNFKM